MPGRIFFFTFIVRQTCCVPLSIHDLGCMAFELFVGSASSEFPLVNFLRVVGLPVELDAKTWLPKLSRIPKKKFYEYGLSSSVAQ